MQSSKHRFIALLNTGPPELFLPESCTHGIRRLSPRWLHGCWRLLRADAALDFAPGVRMEFAEDGRLQYHIQVGAREQVISLLYKTEGDLLHTENPAAPHAMSVRFSHGPGDMLVLDFGGAHAWLVRESTITPG